MHLQSSCCTNINLLLFLLFSLLLPLLLLKLSFVVIQKCYHHGNVTSLFSSLLYVSQEVFIFKLYFCFTAEIIMLDGLTCVYRSNVDLYFYVMGSSNENEVEV